MFAAKHTVRRDERDGKFRESRNGFASPGFTRLYKCLASPAAEASKTRGSSKSEMRHDMGAELSCKDPLRFAWPQDCNFVLLKIMYSLKTVSRPLYSLGTTRLAFVQLPIVDCRGRAATRTFTVAKSSERSSSHAMVRDNVHSAAAEDKQDRAAEMVVDAAHEKVAACRWAWM